MTRWHLLPPFDAYARSAGDRVVIHHGDARVTWGDLNASAAALSADLRSAGVTHQGKVAAFLYNCPQFLATYVGALAAGAVPLNCNYRYGGDELRSVLDDADAEAVVFHSSLLPTVERARDALHGVRRWYVVRDDDRSLPSWTTVFDDLPRHDVTRLPPPQPSGDDLLLLYTGGTTGRPKGVMWRCDDLVQALGRGGHRLLDVAPAATPAELLARAESGTHGPTVLITCPLMHGTGLFSALSTMLMGGTIVLPTSQRLDPAELWSLAARRSVDSMIVVGQAFAGPMLDHLREHRDQLDLESLRLITSSGVMWSKSNKDGLLELLPHVVLLDNYGSSEAVGVGSSISRRGVSDDTATFRLGKRSAVFTEDGRRVEPGSGERGLVAMTGPLPLGYYKDEVKTAQTFRTFEGTRWSVPGDWAEIDSDGTVRLLGRGSSCINTGGEKVFPEEVEEVLKLHPAVGDSGVVGLRDDRFGEIVAAVAETSSTVDTTELQAWVRDRLASFKVPRRVVLVDQMPRHANGKLDLDGIRAILDQPG